MPRGGTEQPDEVEDEAGDEIEAEPLSAPETDISSDVVEDDEQEAPADGYVPMSEWLDDFDRR